MTPAKNLINAVQEFVSSHLKETLSADLCFHNYSHTKEVVFASEEIAAHCELSEEEKEILTIAAWFHDCGYSICYRGHEEFSSKMAKDFLAQFNYPPLLIGKVMDCIASTKYPQDPKTTAAMILCDADFFHFARTDYDHHERGLRKEWEFFLNKYYTDAEWHELNCKLLMNHQYFTEYGKQVLQKFKDVNLGLMNCKTRS